MDWVRVLRAGALLSCGWVACAVVVWGRFGPLWALLVMMVWLATLAHFQRAMQQLARGVAAAAAARGGPGEAAPPAPGADDPAGR